MRSSKRIQLAMGLALTIAASVLAVNASGEPVPQLIPEAAQIIAKETGIFSAVLTSETVKGISVPSEGYYTCKDGKAAVEIKEISRLSLGSPGGSFLLTLSSGRKVIVFAPLETAFKTALSVAVESQLTGIPVTFRNNNSPSQDEFFQNACDGVDKLSIANEITISK